MTSVAALHIARGEQDEQIGHLEIGIMARLTADQRTDPQIGFEQRRNAVTRLRAFIPGRQWI